MRETTREKAPIFYMVVVLFATLMPYAFQSMNAIADIQSGLHLRGKVGPVATTVGDNESSPPNARTRILESRASR